MNSRLLTVVCVVLAGLVTLPGGTSSQSQNLNTFNGCPMEGSSTSKCTQENNRLKNRWKPPADSDINKGITLASVLKSGDDEDRWSTDDAAEVTGFVAHVTGTGPESCNCKGEEEEMQDIHIDLVQSRQVEKNKKTHGCNHFVVEITPRWKHMKGWTLDEIRKLEGKWVRFRGWMFFDRYHLKEAANTRFSKSFTCSGPKSLHRCGAKKNEIWRATAWELHPVTSFEVLPGPPSD